VEWIRSRDGAVTIKELQRSNGRKYPTREAAEAALNGLAEENLGQWQDRPAGPQGGRPSRLFVLGNVSDETDESSPGGLRLSEGLSDETYFRNDQSCEFFEKNEVSSVSSDTSPRTKADGTPQPNCESRADSSDSPSEVSSEDYDRKSNPFDQPNGETPGS
jgi:hypothetical protein